MQKMLENIRPLKAGSTKKTMERILPETVLKLKFHVNRKENKNEF